MRCGASTGEGAKASDSHGFSCSLWTVSCGPWPCEMLGICPMLTAWIKAKGTRPQDGSDGWGCAILGHYTPCPGHIEDMPHSWQDASGPAQVRPLAVPFTSQSPMGRGVPTDVDSHGNSLFWWHNQADNGVTRLHSNATRSCIYTVYNISCKTTTTLFPKSRLDTDMIEMSLAHPHNAIS